MWLRCWPNSVALCHDVAHTGHNLGHSGPMLVFLMSKLGLCCHISTTLWPLFGDFGAIAELAWIPVGNFS